MRLSTRTIERTYYHFALIVFGIGASMFMHEQDNALESSGHTALIGAFVFVVWFMFSMSLYKKVPVFPRPDRVIAFYSLYFLWVISVAFFLDITVQVKDAISHFFQMSIPMLVLIVSYYHTLYNDCRKSDRHFYCIVAVILAVMYFKIWTIQNLFEEQHLGTAYYLLFALPLILINPSKIIKTMGLLMVTIIVFSSVKRGGILALFLGLFAYIIIRQRIGKGNKWLNYLITVCSISGVLGIFFFLAMFGETSILERFENVGNDEGSGRTLVWAEAWRLIQKGDAFEFFIGHGHNTVVRDSIFALSAHNDYLEAWHDYGLIGMILYILAVVSLVAATYKSVRMKHPYSPAFCINVVNVILLSMVSHVAMYFWMSIVMLSTGVILGKIDHDECCE